MWVYTFDAVKRFDTLSYASQMPIKTFCGVSVYTFHASISARQRARESVARRNMIQSSTVLNFRALSKEVFRSLLQGGFILLTQSSAEYAATLCAGSRH